MTHPAFPHDWPTHTEGGDPIHPMGFVFLHPPTEGRGSAGVTFDVKQINSLCQFLFDDLGCTLPSTPPRSETITLTVEPSKVGKDFTRTVDITGAPVRVTRGSLPPGLALAAGVITGQPERSGRWLIECQIGPQVHYQRPMNAGPIGPHNRGRWVDIRTPLEDPPVAKALRDLDPEEIEKIRAGLAEYDAEQTAANEEPKEES